MPEKLAQMRDIFLIEAAKNKALQIGGGLWVPVLHPEQRIVTPYKEWTFSGDITRMPEFCAPALGKKPHVVTPLLFTANDCLDIGTALGSAVSPDYHQKVPFAFNGHLGEVRVQYLTAGQHAPRLEKGAAAAVAQEASHALP
jgi:hypothetical protein